MSVPINSGWNLYLLFKGDKPLHGYIFDIDAQEKLAMYKAVEPNGLYSIFVMDGSYIGCQPPMGAPFRVNGKDMCIDEEGNMVAISNMEAHIEKYRSL